MRVSQPRNVPRSFSKTPVAAAIMLALASPAVTAQEQGIEEIIVTSQKREENLQDVPISIQALGNKTLTDLNVKNFKDYVQLLPTVAITPSIGAGSGFTQVYMRGVATGGDGQATTSQPSVGMYLDEQPITTIQGNLDVHMYDIARVEALAGPQGTLYGASSQAGTIRIITNKPDASGFAAGYAVEGNIVDSDDSGYVLEGFVNIPIGENTAVRLVGWARSDAGWIDNVLGSRTFPGIEFVADPASPDPDNPDNLCPLTVDCSADDITISNAEFAEDNYNTIDTIGARAALRIDLNDEWTLTPTVQVQKQEGEGSWGDDLSSFVPGDYAVTHFQQEYTNDEWYQVGLTIEGTIANFDLVYSGNYLERDVDGSFDYSDYSYWYDTTYTTGFFADLHYANTGPRDFPNQFDATAGSRISPAARFTNDDHYEKQSHELRISTSQDNRVRGMLGFFWQEQYHDFEQHWLVEGLADAMEMNGGASPRFDNTVYMNSMDRNDSDRAVFGQVAFDITDAVELTVGARYFKPEVEIEGFFGFGQGFIDAGWGSSGEAQCDLLPGGQTDFKDDAPCKNVQKGIAESDVIFRVNLSWQASDESLVYTTWSEGYRPGGVQRNPFAGNYVSDFLTNWEAGYKTQWLDNRMQFNAAVFLEQWDDFQVSFTGDNGITQVANGPSAEILGTEMQVLWLATDDLTISAAAAYYDTELKDAYCPGCNDDGSPWAPEGAELPVTAGFKGNAIARYLFPLGNFEAHVQGAISYEGERGSDMNQADNAVRGDVPKNTFVDLSTGLGRESWRVELFVMNATDEDAPLYLVSECPTSTCGTQNYGVRSRPRTIGLKFSQEFGD
jgi:iron complex outermembrane recepter protein